jgi:hypothetical protein
MSHLPINTYDTHKWWSVVPSKLVTTFEFLHNYCHKSSSKAYKGGSVFVLKSSSPLCCEFLHLFHVFVFGIIGSLSWGREIFQVMCF